MRTVRSVLILLRPSLLSGVFSTVTTVAFLGVTSWAFITHNPAFRTYFLGPDGLTVALRDAPFRVDTISRDLFAQGVGRNILSYVFIFLIVIVVFTMLEVAVAAAGGLSAVLSDLRSASTRRFTQLQRTIWTRIVCRVLVAAVWLAYIAVFLSSIVPFCVSETRYGIATSASNPSHLEFVAIAVVVALAALHAHIILARMLVLRLRIFGGTASLLELESIR